MSSGLRLRTQGAPLGLFLRDIGPANPPALIRMEWMEDQSSTGPRPRHSGKFLGRAGLAFLFVLTAGCARWHTADTSPLDKSGMDYEAISTVRSLNVNEDEVAGLVKAKAAGIPDDAIIAMIRMARDKGKLFDFGETAANLYQSGFSADSILELERLDQLEGLHVGELEAIRLTGMSDAVCLEVAERWADGKQAPTGVSLVKLRDARISEHGMIALMKLGLTDKEVPSVLEMRRRRMKEDQIIVHFRAAPK